MRSLFAVRGASTGERLVRGLALVAVIAIVAWAFWYNNAQVVHRLNQGQSYWDETKTLGAEDRQFIREVQQALAERFHLELIVQVRKGAIVLPKMADDTLFVGLSPARQEAMVIFPPELDDEAGRHLAGQLHHDHFAGQWEHWPDALRTALVMIWDHVNRVRQGAGEGARASQYVLDETGRLGEADLAWLDAYGRELRAQLGQDLMVRVYNGPVQVPGLDATTLFVGLSPARGEAFVRLPLALRAALGPEGESRLRDAILPALPGDWPGALKRGLGEAFSKATGAAVPDAPATPSPVSVQPPSPAAPNANQP